MLGTVKKDDGSFSFLMKVSGVQSLSSSRIVTSWMSPPYFSLGSTHFCLFAILIQGNVNLTNYLKVMSTSSSISLVLRGPRALMYMLTTTLIAPESVKEELPSDVGLW